MKLESFHSADDKRKFKIVRTDYVDGGEVPGEIVSADEDTGECSVAVPSQNRDAEGKLLYETKAMNFGPGGIRLIARGR